MGLISEVISGIISPLASIGTKIVDLKIAREKATTDQERMRIDEQIKTLELQQTVLIKTADHWTTITVHFSFAMIFLLYEAKLIVWDKLLGWGSTDPLSADQKQLEMIVIGFYFLYNAVKLLKR